MNKHLNNFLDKTEGLPEETSNNNIRKEMARQLGSAGGKKSVQKRFQGKSKEEISKMMKDIRKGYTIKERTFDALKETNPKKRAKFNAEVLTSEFMPNIKYQLVALSTEFLFETKEECYKQLTKLGIPL